MPRKVKSVKKSINTVDPFWGNSGFSGPFDHGIESNDQMIKWRIVKQLQSYNPETKKCRLCIGENMEILELDPANLLNKQSELVSTCRHRNKFLLHQYDVG